MGEQSELRLWIVAGALIVAESEAAALEILCEWHSPEEVALMRDGDGQIPVVEFDVAHDGMVGMFCERPEDVPAWMPEAVDTRKAHVLIGQNGTRIAKAPPADWVRNSGRGMIRPWDYYLRRGGES